MSKVISVMKYNSASKVGREGGYRIGLKLQKGQKSRVLVQEAGIDQDSICLEKKYQQKIIQAEKCHPLH